MTWCLRIGLLVLWSAMALPGMAAASDAWLARASSEHPGGFKASLAVDGKRDTRWASQGDGLQRLDIDFGRPVPVTRAVIRWEAAYATAYALLVSDDGKAWRSAAERKDGKGGVETVGGFAATGRYLRVECRAAGPHKLYSIWELEFPEAEPARALQARAAERAARAGEPKRKLLAALKEAGARAIVFALRKPVGDGHWYANFGYYAECENPRGVPGSARVGDRNVAYRPGGRLCRLDLDTGRVVNLLDDPEGGVRDPFVEADGRTILFSYRQGTNANYHLYTIRSDGTELRQLTDGPYDDIEPCRLPDGDILFVSSRCKRWVNCWVTQVATLHRGRADGSEVQAAVVFQRL